jgi:hypothetical protein
MGRDESFADGPDPAYRRIKRTGLHRTNAVRRPRKKASQLAKFIGKLTGGSPPEVARGADAPYGAPDHPLSKLDTSVPGEVKEIDLSDSFQYREYFAKKYSEWHSIPFSLVSLDTKKRLYSQAWRRLMIRHHEDHLVAGDSLFGERAAPMPERSGMPIEELMGLVPDIEGLPKFHADLELVLRTQYRGFSSSRYRNDIPVSRDASPAPRRRKMSF